MATSPSCIPRLIRHAGRSIGPSPRVWRQGPRESTDHFRDGGPPIILLAAHHQPDDVFESIAAPMLRVSSLHDGMNLVARVCGGARRRARRRSCHDCRGLARIQRSADSESLPHRTMARHCPFAKHVGTGTAGPESAMREVCAISTSTVGRDKCCWTRSHASQRFTQRLGPIGAASTSPWHRSVPRLRNHATHSLALQPPLPLRQRHRGLSRYRRTLAEVAATPRDARVDLELIAAIPWLRARRGKPSLW